MTIENFKRIVDECYVKAKEIICAHEDVLHGCAGLLLEKEKISRAEFEALFEAEPVQKLDDRTEDKNEI